MARTSQRPDQLATLLRIVEHELGYHLYRTVSAAKAELSRAGSTVLRFRHEGVAIERTITRADFEFWIAPDLARLAAAVRPCPGARGAGGGAGRPRVPDRRHRVRPGGQDDVRGQVRAGPASPAAASSSRWRRDWRLIGRERALVNEA